MDFTKKSFLMPIISIHSLSGKLSARHSVDSRDLDLESLALDGDLGEGADDAVDAEAKKAEYTTPAMVVFFIANAVLLQSNILKASVAPLLPRHLEVTLGVKNTAWVGVIYGAFQAALLVVFPLMPLLTAKYGRLNVLWSSLLLLGLSVIAFGKCTEWVLAGGESSTSSGLLSSLGLSPSPTALILTLMIVSRLISGVATAGTELVSFAVLTDRFPLNLGFIMGFAEVVGGAGFTLGPVLGSWLEHISNNDFAVPFVVTGVATCLLIIPVVMSRSALAYKPVRSDKEVEEGRKSASSGINLLEDEERDEEMREREPLLDAASPARGRALVGSAASSESIEGDDVPAVIPSPAVRRKSQMQGQDVDDEDDAATSFSVSKFFEIMNREFLLAGGFLCLGCMLFGFVEPIYAIHAADEVHLTPLTIGTMYFVLAGSYCISGAPLGNLGDSAGYVRVMLAGAAVSCLCLL